MIDNSSIWFQSRDKNFHCLELSLRWIARFVTPPFLSNYSCLFIQLVKILFSFVYPSVGTKNLMLSGGKKSIMNQRFVSQGTDVLYQPGLHEQLHLQWILFSSVVCYLWSSLQYDLLTKCYSKWHSVCHNKLCIKYFYTVHIFCIEKCKARNHPHCTNKLCFTNACIITS